MCMYIFDKDGVLLDTEEAKICSYYQVLRELIPQEVSDEKKYTEWHKETLTGKSRAKVVKGIIEKYPGVARHDVLLKSREALKEKWESCILSDPKYEEARREIESELKEHDFDDFPPELLLSIHRLIKYAEIPIEKKCKPVDPVLKFFRSLQAKLPVSLVTEAKLERTKQELRHVGLDIDSFEIVICKDRVYCKGKESESPKDKKAMYSMISQEFCKEYHIAIEDTLPGMEAAMEAGVPCFLPRDGRYDKEVVSILRAVCMPDEKAPSEPLHIGVDFGGAHTTVGFGEILWLRLPYSFEEKGEEEIAQFLKKICGSLTVRALGIALACTLVPADRKMQERRISEYSTKFSSLSKVEEGNINKIQDRWEEKLGVPVFILNDGEAAAIAEHQKGGGRGSDNVLVLTLGTSIGAGFIFHGKLLVGPYSSRASHIILDPEGEWCKGENHKGCWKTLAGRDAFSELAGNMGFPKDSKEISEKAQEGDPKVQLFYKYYAERVAAGIANIVGAVPFERIVIGGGIAQAGDVFFDPLKERLERGDLLDSAIVAAFVSRIVPAELREPVVVGAQLYAEEKLQSQGKKKMVSKRKRWWQTFQLLVL